VGRRSSCAVASVLLAFVRACLAPTHLQGTRQKRLAASGSRAEPIAACASSPNADRRVVCDASGRTACCSRRSVLAGAEPDSTCITFLRSRSPVSYGRTPERSMISIARSLRKIQALPGGGTSVGRDLCAVGATKGRSGPGSAFPPTATWNAPGPRRIHAGVPRRLAGILRVAWHPDHWRAAYQ